MTQPGFFKQPEPMTLGEIAALTGAQLADPSQAGQTVSGTSTLDQAGPRDLAFFDKRKYGDELNRSHAGACLVSAGLQADVPGQIDPAHPTPADQVEQDVFVDLEAVDPAAQNLLRLPEREVAGRDRLPG